MPAMNLPTHLKARLSAGWRERVALLLETLRASLLAHRELSKAWLAAIDGPRAKAVADAKVEG